MNEFRYRVRFGPVELETLLGGRGTVTVPFLTSTVALAYAAEQKWRVAEEFDGKVWLRFSKDRTETVAA